MNTMLSSKKAKTIITLLMSLIATLCLGIMAFAAPGGLKQTAASEDRVTVQWDADVTADDYMISWSNDNQTWSTPERTYGAIDYKSNLTAGKTYYYKIQSIDSKGNPVSDFSASSSAVTQPTKIDKNTLVQTAATTNSIKYSWKAVAGATRYDIYRTVGYGSSYKKIGATSSTNFTIKSVTYSSNYYYYFCPVRVGSTYTAGSPNYSTYINNYQYKLQPTKTSAVKINYLYLFSKSLSLTWNKKDKADGYQVYVYKNTDKKPFTKKNVTYNSLNLNKINTKTFYRAQVRAYVNLNGKKVYGAWSTVNYFGSQPEVELKNISGNRLNASWNKTAGATSYTVYVSTKQKSGYKVFKTLKGTSININKYGKTALKNNKTYFVYVVANKKIGTKTYKTTSTYAWSLKLK